MVVSAALLIDERGSSAALLYFDEREPSAAQFLATERESSAALFFASGLTLWILYNLGFFGWSSINHNRDGFAQFLFKIWRSL